MTKKKVTDFNIDELLESAREPIVYNIVDAMNEWGLEYAYATLLDRALVSNYDFVKPVQLRSIWGMYKLGLRPDKKNVKEGHVTSYIMTRYHPHAAQAIKGVVDGWAQKFNSRVPLVKATGQPGLFAGDTAPAERYLEVGMNKACYELVRDTQQHGCTWTYNENGDEIVPLFLPVRFPVGIINGVQGIATGFACNIPPHNPDEVMQACIAYLQGKLDKPEKLLKYIKGPDFPTGASIVGTDGVKEYLLNGSGKFLVYGKYNIVEEPHGRTEIVFTELPYNVSVEQVMSDIAQKKNNGLFAEISEMKNLSDRKRQTDKSEVRLTLYVKAGANIPKLIDSLYKNTRCMASFSVNTTLIDNYVPRQNVPVFDMIKGFCTMRQDVVHLRYGYRLKQIDRDLYTLDGLMKILVDIDKAIYIIRHADNSDIACQQLQKTFKVEEKQANQILAMPLRQLTKADVIEAETKKKSLDAEAKNIRTTLSDEKVVNEEIIKELKETESIITSGRRTEIVDMSLEELKQQQKEIEKQHKLLAKGVECFVNINKDKIGKSIEHNDNSKFKVMSDSNIFIIGKDGNCKELEVEKLPLDDEQSISIFANGNEDIVGVTSDNGYETLIVSNLGNINVFKNRFKSGLLCKLKDEELMFASPINEEDRKNNSLIMINKHGELFKMDIEKLKSVNAGSGLIVGTKMKDIIFAGIVHHNNVIKTVSNNEVKYTSIEECPSKGRGSSGYLLHKLKKDDEIISCEIVEMSDEVILTNRGKSGVKRK
jgi:DNA gyrase/topoisomerase IV subunit A